jgi:hypothetical protein
MQPVVRAERLVPAIGRRSLLDLSSVVLAKYADGPKGPQLVAQVDNYQTQQRDVTVTRMIAEKRTRKVKVGTPGEEKVVEQEYTVQIPVTETVKQAVRVPAEGKRLQAFPLDEVSIYRLDATPVSDEDTKQLLEKMTPIFLLNNFQGEVKPIEGPMLQALNPNCLIVVVKPPVNVEAPKP